MTDAKWLEKYNAVVRERDLLRERLAGIERAVTAFDGFGCFSGDCPHLVMADCLGASLGEVSRFVGEATAILAAETAEAIRNV